jgi:hypothetical protein
LLYKIVTSEDNNKKYPLKNKIIHIISNATAVKAGASNINASDL